MLNKYVMSSLLLAVFLAVGCTQKQEQTQQKESQVVTANSTPAKKTLKPGAPVILLNPQLVKMAVNQPTAVNLQLQVLQQGRLVLNLSTTENLQLIATQSRYVLDVNATEVTLPVQLSASADGRFYLNIEASFETSEGQTARNLAVVVQVGDAQSKALKPSAQALQQQSDAVVSMPAQETIKP